MLLYAHLLPDNKRQTVVYLQMLKPYLPSNCRAPENINLGIPDQFLLNALDQLWRRWSHDHKLNNLYRNFIEEYLSLDHMEQITNIDDIASEEDFFLPHHGVLNPEQGVALVPIEWFLTAHKN
ncbi:hypothetical protein TNIN_364691 [Trichonephila inaurata madagascariensis]|uniref:Uncharacterized protein n=1 Tax=Trichonephila inaurata madagascariensis TaxID=2747483 RepID=A0A8X7BSA4_9ARAC|nr:hypothetical protein TNIN_364691 [Trichonephila inaurata madagascariensis]